MNDGQTSFENIVRNILRRGLPALSHWGQWRKDQQPVKGYPYITYILIIKSFSNSAQGITVSLPCSVQNLKVIGQPSNKLWANKISHLCEDYPLMRTSNITKLGFKGYPSIISMPVARSFWNFAQSTAVSLPCSTLTHWDQRRSAQQPVKEYPSITSIHFAQSFFAKSMAVPLPCFVQNFKMIGKWRNMSWANNLVRKIP